MTKAEYLKELERRIRLLPDTERADIMADYREHFEMAKANGKTEEQTCASLGTPRSVAQSILMNTWVQEARGSGSVGTRAQALLRILLLVLVLAPFNFIILVGPFLALFATLFAGWFAPIVVAGTITWVMLMLLKAGLAGFGVFSALSVFSMYVGVLGLAVMLCMIMLLLTRGSLSLLVGFFKWNIDFITSRKG